MYTAEKERTNGRQQPLSAEAPLPNFADSANQAIERISLLDCYGTLVKRAVHNAILKGGAPTRALADLLHGTWLGHPLHPVLTDVTVGAWMMAAVFDVLSLIQPSVRTEEAADTLTTIGTLSAVPTALAGMTDYSAIKKDAVSHGALHAVLNSAGLVLYVLSLRARRSGNRPLGIGLSMLGLGGLALSAWIGGEMVYRHRVGVNHAPAPTQTDRWTIVMAEADLPEQQPVRVQVNGQPVLLYRRASDIYAIGAVCAHAGGPLDEGDFDGVCVQCPWHDSVYDLRDGHVVHGPSTYGQPAYEARILGGQIEVRHPG